MAQVQSATLGTHGFALDRIFCVVDLDGTRHPKCEALSQRKLPALGAITTTLSEDGASLTLSTPNGDKPLVLATDAAAIAREYREYGVVEEQGSIYAATARLARFLVDPTRVDQRPPASLPSLGP